MTYTVESHYSAPASNGNPPVTERIYMSLEKFFFILYIGNKRNPPLTDKDGWFLEIRQCGSLLYKHSINDFNIGNVSEMLVKNHVIVDETYQLLENVSSIIGLLDQTKTTTNISLILNILELKHSEQHYKVNHLNCNSQSFIIAHG